MIIHQTSFTYLHVLVFIKIHAVNISLFHFILNFFAVFRAAYLDRSCWKFDGRVWTSHCWVDQKVDHGGSKNHSSSCQWEDFDQTRATTFCLWEVRREIKAMPQFKVSQHFRYFLNFERLNLDCLIHEKSNNQNMTTIIMKSRAALSDFWKACLVLVNTTNYHCFACVSILIVVGRI